MTLDPPCNEAWGWLGHRDPGETLVVRAPVESWPGAATREKPEGGFRGLPARHFRTRTRLGES